MILEEFEELVIDLEYAAIENYETGYPLDKQALLLARKKVLDAYEALTLALTQQ